MLGDLVDVFVDEVVEGHAVDLAAAEALSEVQRVGLGLLLFGRLHFKFIMALMLPASLLHLQEQGDEEVQG